MKASDKELKRLLGETFGDVSRSDATPVFERLIEEGIIDTSAPRMDGRLKARLWLSAHCGCSTSPGVVLTTLLVILIVATSLLTPADNALARWVGQVFGIGEPGGQPTLTGDRALRGGPWNPTRSDPLVLGEWREPGSGRMELVGWRSGDGDLCFAADDASQDMNSWFCVADPPSVPPVRAASVRPSRSAATADARTGTLIGRVNERVAKVRLLEPGSESLGEVRTIRPVTVPLHLSKMLGTAQPFGLFMATVGSTDAVLVEGLDSQGVSVGRTVVSLIDDIESGDSPVVPADLPTSKRNER